MVEGIVEICLCTIRGKIFVEYYSTDERCNPVYDESKFFLFYLEEQVKNFLCAFHFLLL